MITFAGFTARFTVLETETLGVDRRRFGETAGPAGSFTITDAIMLNGWAAGGSKAVTVNPNPSGTI